MIPIQSRAEAEAVLKANEQLKAVREAEKKVDEVKQQLDSLTAEDFEILREKRRLQLKHEAAQMQLWRVQGHGVLQEIQDQKDWFNICKTNERVVTHFYRPTTPLCEVMDKHLTVIARKHMETKFIKINAEKAPFLAQRLNIEVLPTLLMSSKNFAESRLVGFEGVDGLDKCKSEALERVLAQKGVITVEGDPFKQRNAAKKAAADKAAVRKSSLNRDVNEDSDSDW